MNRRRRVLSVAVLAAVLAVASVPARAADPTIKASAVVKNLGFPSMFTFDPDQSIFYSELKTGRIGVVKSTKGASPSTYFQVPDLCTDDDQGLFGLALHPDYPEAPFLYAYATRSVSGTCMNQVLQIEEKRKKKSKRVGAAMTVLFSEEYTGEHVGGRLLFGPDDNLYVSTGDGGDPANAQDPGNGRGKILRMNADGDAPADNPQPGSLVFASGFRNVFGFDFDPDTGRLWATENGPACNDELNVVVAGGNYGWGPAATCATPPDPPVNTNQDGTDPILPAHWYADSDGPTGAAFCSGCGLGSAVEGRFLYGAWLLGEIRAVTLGGDRSSVVSEEVVYQHSRVEAPLSIEAAPDGSLWFSDKSGIYKLKT